MDRFDKEMPRLLEDRDFPNKAISLQSNAKEELTHMNDSTLFSCNLELNRGQM